MDEDFLARLMASQDAPARRRRRGLAGVWDRNKQIIKPVVSGLAGAFGTPMLGAAVGAAMGGLDREGRGGIGFDAGQGVRGGLEGYAAGKAGEFLGNKAGIQPLLGPNAARGAAQQAVPQVAQQGAGAALPMPAADVSSMGRNAAFEAGQAVPMPAAAPVGQAVQQSAGATAPALDTMRQKISSTTPPPSLLGRAGRFVEGNPMAAGMGLQALSGILGSQSERRLREREQAEERRRAQNLAMFAAPLYQNIGGQR